MVDMSIWLLIWIVGEALFIGMFCMAAWDYFSCRKDRNSWNPPTLTPVLTPGRTADIGQFIVAVTWGRIPESRRVNVYTAYYLKDYPLMSDDKCLINLSDSECEDTHEDGCPVTGWHVLGTGYGTDYDEFYTPLLGSNGDELKGWRRLPKWTEKDSQ